MIRRIVLTALALTLTASVAAICVQSQLPSPPGGKDAGTFVSTLVLCLTGPILFRWSWGTHLLEPGAIAAWVIFSTASVGLYWRWLSKPPSAPTLIAAASLWSGFGGFSAYLAISGSI